MTWGWGTLPKGAAGGMRHLNIGVGNGPLGTVAEVKKPTTWPQYEAEYLKKALNSQQGKYNTANLGDTEKFVYLDKVTRGCDDEAEQLLKFEFEQWLQGRHPEYNCNSQAYVNEEGRPVRRFTDRGAVSDDALGKPLLTPRDNWMHTPWQSAQLTGLPGVRDYLRKNYATAVSDEIQLNLLADHGPQNLEQAWMYFKHWVKGRPLSDTYVPAGMRPRVTTADTDPNDKSLYGNQVPHNMFKRSSDPIVDQQRNAAVVDQAIDANIVQTRPRPMPKPGASGTSTPLTLAAAAADRSEANVRHLEAELTEPGTNALHTEQQLALEAAYRENAAHFERLEQAQALNAQIAEAVALQHDEPPQHLLTSD